MRTIADLLSPKKQLFQLREIVAVEGDKKLDILLIVSK